MWEGRRREASESPGPLRQQVSGDSDRAAFPNLTEAARQPDGWRESGGCPLVAASVATLGHVRGRGPMDTSSAQQDEVDIGRDGADGVGGTEP